MKDETYILHQRDILKLKIEIKNLLHQINCKNAEIEQLKEWNRQIIGRE